MVINQRSIKENTLLSEFIKTRRALLSDFIKSQRDTLLLAQFQLRFNELEQQVAEWEKKVERAKVIFSKKV